MRAARAATALSLVVFSFCLAGRASAALPRVALSTRFSPDRLGQSTTIYYGFKISQPAPLKSMELRLPAGMGYAASSIGLESCPAALLEEGPEYCPPDSRVGFGTAFAELPMEGLRFSYDIDEPAYVTAVLGPPEGEGMTLLFFVEGRSPVSVERILVGHLVPTAGLYGEVLKINVPLFATWFEGPDVGMTRLQSSLGPHGLRYYHREDGKRVAFTPRGISVPATCPPGGFPFLARFRWYGGGTATARSTVRCPKPSPHRAKR